MTQASIEGAKPAERWCEACRSVRPAEGGYVKRVASGFCRTRLSWRCERCKAYANARNAEIRSEAAK